MSMGFENVANLTGGINAWIQSGHPVVSGVELEPVS